jgi:hypothetical protein
VKVGTSCCGKIKRAPHLYRAGRGVAGWRATKDELRERKAFKRLPPDKAAKIEAEKLEALRETIDSIFG